MEREQLPVKHFEEEIMAAVDNNPVVIIRGATGCGKTTQVPQYILERFVKGHRASDCNIVVTQVTSTHRDRKRPSDPALSGFLKHSEPDSPPVSSPGGSAPCPWLRESPSREERISGKAVATASASSPSSPDLTPASCSAPSVRESQQVLPLSGSCS